MKPPQLAETATPPQPEAQSQGAQGVVTPTAAVSFNHLSGTVSNSVFQYPNEWSYSWYVAYEKFRVTGVGLIALGRDGTVKDRIVPGAGRGQITEGTSFILEHAGKQILGGCLTATVRVTRELNLLPRETIVLQISNADGQVKSVFRGYIESPPVNYQVRTIEGHTDIFEYSLLGWKGFSEDVKILSRTFEGVDVGEAIRVLVQSELALKTPILYDPSLIPDVGYTLVKQEFKNVSVLSALDTLVQMTGGYVQGVDARGYYYLQQKEDSAIDHYWLGQHPVRLTNLKLDTTQIKNFVFVQAPAVEGQGPSYTLIYDQESVDKWGRIEEIIQFPSTRLPVSKVAITGVTGSKGITLPENAYDGNPASYAEMETQVNDYIDVEINLSSAVTGLVIKQGNEQGQHVVRDFDLYDGSELVREVRGATTDTTVTFPVKVTDSLRLVAKSLPTSNKWQIVEIQFQISDLSDARRYGEAYISASKDPLWSGQMEMEPGIFAPPQPMRVTDQQGVTRYFDSSQTTYTFQPYLQAVTDIGKGQMELGKALALKDRADKAQDITEGQITDNREPVVGVSNSDSEGTSLVGGNADGNVSVKKIQAGRNITLQDTEGAVIIQGSKTIVAGPGILITETEEEILLRAVKITRTVTVVSPTTPTNGKSNFEMDLIREGALLRITASGPSRLGLYYALTDRTVDAPRFDDNPTEDPTLARPLAQITFTSEKLSVVMLTGVDSSTVQARVVNLGSPGQITYTMTMEDI